MTNLTSPDILHLKTQLNSFVPAIRDNALKELLQSAASGIIMLSDPLNAVNMHAHTFFSYNAYGHSPASLAWLAREYRFKAIGIVDFDVLDAVDEFLAACDQTSVRGSCAIETRVYVPEFSTREISSPGEPGVAYHMGVGFTSSTATGRAAEILADMRRRASERNRDLIAKVNSHLSPVVIDYERDVLPLTPAGNATERHILVAYTQAAHTAFAGDSEKLIQFWSSRLDTTRDTINGLLNDIPKLHNLIRTKLMKRGGVGYAQPGPSTFPSIDDFHTFVTGCRALPCATWLDGTSSGEQAIEEYLNLLISKGAAALNIIPDRNWNIVDTQQKAIKLRNLYDVVALAQKLDLPLNIGTEMNAYGQRLVDDFDAPELAPVRDAFIAGALFIYGHTQMERHLGMGYQSEWARSYLDSRAKLNSFYESVGRNLHPGTAVVEKLHRINKQATPEAVLREISG